MSDRAAAPEPEREVDVGVLRACLGDPDESVRVNAALDLADAGRAEGVDVLVDALGHDFGVVRRSFALPALVRVGEPAVGPLARAVSSEPPRRALGAGLALAEIDGERFPPRSSLSGALASGDRDAAEDALQFLWRRPDLSEALHDDLLALVAAPAEVDPGTEWPSEPRATAALLLGRDSPSSGALHDALTALLHRPSDVLRWAAGLALGLAGRSSAAAVTGLAARAADGAETPEVRVAALYAHARIADPVRETLPLLERLVRTAQPAWVRVVAVRIAGELGRGEPLHRPADNVFACHFSAHPLAALPDAARALPVATAALGDADHDVRRSSVLALAWLGAAAAPACEPLATLLEEPYFGPLAAEALARIGESSRPWLSRAGGAAGAYGLELLDGASTPTFRPPVGDFYIPVKVDWTPAKLAACEALYERSAARGGDVEYDLPLPKHEFLAYLSDVRRLLLHGSHRGDLDVLRPLRSSTDASAHGNVSGIYAEPDAIRPIYFAVIDRSHSFGLMNSCFAVGDDGITDDRLDDPSLQRYYRLSIGAQGLCRSPWRSGTVYALPRDTFEFWEEWTSRVPVHPVLRLAVDADDLPLKDDLWGSDLRKPGSIFVDAAEPYSYLEDVWAIPLRTLPRRP